VVFENQAVQVVICRLEGRLVLWIDLESQLGLAAASVLLEGFSIPQEAEVEEL
jgi:hypothetical protein